MSQGSSAFTTAPASRRHSRANSIAPNDPNYAANHWANHAVVNEALMKAMTASNQTKDGVLKRKREYANKFQGNGWKDLWGVLTSGQLLLFNDPETFKKRKDNGWKGFGDPNTGVSEYHTESSDLPR